MLDLAVPAQSVQPLRQFSRLVEQLWQLWTPYLMSAHPGNGQSSSQQMQVRMRRSQNAGSSWKPPH